MSQIRAAEEIPVAPNAKATRPRWRPLHGPAPLALALLLVAGCVALAPLLFAGCTGIPRGLEPVGDFDVSRYAGRWYEIARLDHSFERGLVDVSAEYTLLDDGKIGVRNRGYDPEEGAWNEVEGEATLQGQADRGSLSVTFFWPFYGGYHVIALDPEYRWSVVCGPTRGYLWFLAREPALDAQLLAKLEEKVAAWGFDTGELIRVRHGVAPKPTADSSSPLKARESE
ncbi:MAG: lipocalin [Planctomycetota bacterium]|nr:MAG: lipocalin [Planctomycetota bacterium]